MYLAHIFVFAMFVLVVGIVNVPELIHLFKSENKKRIRILINLGSQFLALAIGLILAMKFILSTSIDSTGLSFIDPSVLLIWLSKIQPAKGILYGKENIFTRWIFISFALLMLYLLFDRIRGTIALIRKHSKSAGVNLKINLWLVLCFLLMAALFVLPDGIEASFGLISSRIMLFFFLFLIAWLSANRFPVWLSIPVFVIITYINISLLNIYFNAVKESNSLALEIEEASQKITPSGTVLPVLNSNYWLYGHISNYLGVDKPMVILENYEASLDYFPVRWNLPQIPRLYLGTMSPSEECISWVSNMDNPRAVIEYVFILHEGPEALSEVCNRQLHITLENNYQEVYKSADDRVLLYRLRD